MCFDTAELLEWKVLKEVYSSHLKSGEGESVSPLNDEDNWETLR